MVGHRFLFLGREDPSTWPASRCAPTPPEGNLGGETGGQKFEFAERQESPASLARVSIDQQPPKPGKALAAAYQ